MTRRQALLLAERAAGSPWLFPHDTGYAGRRFADVVFEPAEPPTRRGAGVTPAAAPRCECGSQTTYGPGAGHSSWCPLGGGA